MPYGRKKNPKTTFYSKSKCIFETSLDRDPRINAETLKSNISAKRTLEVSEKLQENRFLGEHPYKGL